MSESLRLLDPVDRTSEVLLMRTLTERSRLGVLARQVRGANGATARRLIAAALPPHVAAMASPNERRRLDALTGSAMLCSARW